MRSVEIHVTNLFTNEKDIMFYDPTMTLLDIQRSVYNEGYELNEIATLESYLDHDWLRKYGIEAVNNIEIMDTPINELLDNYKIYEMVGDNENE